MDGILRVVKGLSRFMYWIAGIALASIVFLTTIDVILRRFKMPIDCCYEIVVLLAGIAVGFSVPQTTLEKGHVVMDFLTVELPRAWQKAFSIVTRILGIGAFAILGWRLFILGNNVAKAGQVSPVLALPEHPVAYGIGVCCFIECLVLLFDLIDQVKGDKA
jgi:TRAP-type C4-dicarboxylate transport system permease small subunit